MYDINKNVDYYSDRYFVQTFCKFIPHGFKINYFPEKSVIIYKCIFESNTLTVPNANILVESLSESYTQTNYTYKYDNCNINGFSIVYLNIKGNYYIISDADCSNRLYPFNLLFGNLKEEEITVHTEAIKEDVVIIEEEEEK